jgi:hypothetical protein
VYHTDNGVERVKEFCFAGGVFFSAAGIEVLLKTRDG